MNPRVIDALKATIAGLLAEFPELADDEALRADTLEGATDINWIVSRLIVGRNEDRAEEDAMRALAKHYLERAAAAERRKDAKAKLALSLLDAAGLRTIRVPEGSVTMVAGRQGITVTDIDALPDWACRIRREPDKSKIAEAFKDGLPCPGAVETNGAPYVTFR